MLAQVSGKHVKIVLDQQNQMRSILSQVNCDFGIVFQDHNDNAFLDFKLKEAQSQCMQEGKDSLCLKFTRGKETITYTQELKRNQVLFELVDACGTSHKVLQNITQDMKINQKGQHVVTHCGLFKNAEVLLHSLPVFEVDY